MDKNLDPLAYSPPPVLNLDPRSAGKADIENDGPQAATPPPPPAPPSPQAQGAVAPARPNAPPAPAKAPLYTAWSRLGPGLPAAKPAPKATLQGFQVPQNQDGAAMAKMALIRDYVVTPALSDTLPHTRAVLAEILRGAPANITGHPAGLWNMVQRIFYWVRSRVRYVRDPRQKELFQALGVTLQNGFGDCDDFTGALAALLKGAGFRVKARVIATRPGGPYVHIYPLVEVAGKWKALDATVNFPPGWESPHTRALELEV